MTLLVAAPNLRTGGTAARGITSATVIAFVAMHVLAAFHTAAGSMVAGGASDCSKSDCSLVCVETQISRSLCRFPRWSFRRRWRLSARSRLHLLARVRRASSRATATLPRRFDDYETYDEDCQVCGEHCVCVADEQGEQIDGEQYEEHCEEEEYEEDEPEYDYDCFDDAAVCLAQGKCVHVGPGKKCELCGKKGHGKFVCFVPSAAELCCVRVSSLLAVSQSLLSLERSPFSPRNPRVRRADRRARASKITQPGKPKGKEKCKGKGGGKGKGKKGKAQAPGKCVYFTDTDQDTSNYDYYQLPELISHYRVKVPMAGNLSGDLSGRPGTHPGDLSATSRPKGIGRPRKLGKRIFVRRSRAWPLHTPQRRCRSHDSASLCVQAADLGPEVVTPL